MAAIHLKPLDQQTIVLTGATSGIGLVTARMAAARGARLFLIARNEAALHGLCFELREKGARAEYAVADVADHAQLQDAADKARAAFGGFDTWINDAGAFVYGALDDTPLEDQRRLFDVDYWGTVHGTLIAEQALAANGGAIINIGSVLGEVAIPFQATYCAAKFAVKGFTEAFRREVEAAGKPISVTLIKPAAINTPYTDHARNRIGSIGTRNPPPAYDPHLVGRAILHAAETPTRDLTIGGLGGVSLIAANLVAPSAVDWLVARIGRPMQRTRNPGKTESRDNLYETRADLAENSALEPFTRKTSLALEAQLNPRVTVLALLGLGAVLRAALRPRPAANPRPVATRPVAPRHLPMPSVRLAGSPLPPRPRLARR